MSKHLSLLCGLALTGCGARPAPPPPPPEPPAVRSTYRVISGVSMGGMGAAALGLSRPDRFDGVGTLGGPLDAAFFFSMVDRTMLGGFCPRATLEALAESAPQKLNDPAVIDACAQPVAPRAFEHANDFNHWYATISGGSFFRDSYINIFEDLTLAFGNFLTENPRSPFAPPGVDSERLRHPPTDFCSAPVVVKGLRNLEWNPEGKYDAITFCDGQRALWRCKADGALVDFCADPANVLAPLPLAQEEPFAQAQCAGRGGAERVDPKADPLVFLDHAGVVDACRVATTPLRVALAVDYNRNGRRDYGEPLINNGQERFLDVGADGCGDAFEDGKGGCAPTMSPVARDPNGDNYDPDTNALGTQDDWLHEEGEPFADDGLDGVPGTSDFGEGNGAYDLTSGRRGLLALDGRSNLRKAGPAAWAGLNLLADGGARDVFNLGAMAKHLFGYVRAVRPQATAYRDFVELPGMVDRDMNFNPWNQRWKSVPRDLLMLYGKERPTEADRLAGEGDHVGTNAQAVARLFVLFNWAAARWPNLERPATPLGGASSGARQSLESFESKALGAKWEYGVALPPGYELKENQDKRYPVLFMLHGYGMEPKGFMGSAIITDVYVTDPQIKFRPMILVFPNGRCCWRHAVTGAVDCRESDETGRPIDADPAFERECKSGSFYVNRRGFAPGDERRYGDAFFELMEHLDARYRTLPTAAAR